MFDTVVHRLCCAEGNLHVASCQHAHSFNLLSWLWITAHKELTCECWSVSGTKVELQPQTLPSFPTGMCRMSTQGGGVGVQEK